MLGFKTLAINAVYISSTLASYVCIYVEFSSDLEKNSKTGMSITIALCSVCVVAMTVIYPIKKKKESLRRLILHILLTVL